MRAYGTLTRRELAGYFLAPTGYVVIAIVTFLVGYIFKVLIETLGSDPTPVPITELFYSTYLFWFVLLLTTPVITMRLFALEKFSGTFETLMTAPVRDAEIVAAKFTASLVFYMVMWLPLLGCILIVRHYSNDPTGFDAGVVGTTFLGIFLLGCLFLSIGCFASALTRSQMGAAMVTLFLSTSLFLLSYLADRLPAADWQSQAIALFRLPDQMHDFARGIVDTRPVVLYLSATFLFLFLSLRVLGSRRWK
jgi:ABC-2 type transport system permease protein